MHFGAGLSRPFSLVLSVSLRLCLPRSSPPSVSNSSYLVILRPWRGVEDLALYGLWDSPVDTSLLLAVVNYNT